MVEIHLDGWMDMQLDTPRYLKAETAAYQCPPLDSWITNRMKEERVSCPGRTSRYPYVVHIGPRGYIGPLSVLGQLSYAVGSFLLPALSPPVTDYRAHSVC